MSILNLPCPHIHREYFQVSGLYVPFLEKKTTNGALFYLTQSKIQLFFVDQAIKHCYFGLTLVMQEIQSTGNLLHNHTGFLLAEVASLVDVSQNGS